MGVGRWELGVVGEYHRVIALGLRLGEGGFTIDCDEHQPYPTPQPLGECNAHVPK
jgi:hypothetical protein